LLGPLTRYCVRPAPELSGHPFEPPRRTRSRKDLCAQHELSAWTGCSSGASATSTAFSVSSWPTTTASVKGASSGSGL
jgi:hypothetical protein